MTSKKFHLCHDSTFQMKETTDMIIRKTLTSSDFSFIVLNLVEKAVLQFLLIIVDYVKERFTKKATDKFQRRAL